MVEELTDGALGQPLLGEVELIFGGALIPDLQNAAGASGGINQMLGGGQVRRDRLFDQHINTGFEQCTTYIGMGRRRDGDDGSVDFAGEFCDRCVGWASVLGGGSGGSLRIAVDYARQFRTGRLAKNTQMMTAKRTGADDRSSNSAQGPTSSGS